MNFQFNQSPNRFSYTLGQMKTLNPSFIRSTCVVVFWLMVTTAVFYSWQGYFEHKWWKVDYLLSLLIPFAIAPIAVWFMFVPRLLAYSETEFGIHPLMSGQQTFPWSELKYYGRGNNVFMIQFEGKQAFQIFAMAYPKREWSDFLAFLKTNFPERKASGSVGPWMFKLGRKP